MNTNIDVRVTASLHPDTVKAVDGYDDDTAPLLASTERAFQEAYTSVGLIYEARDKAANNPTWNASQVAIETDTYAQKHLGKVCKSFDDALAVVTKGIEHIERELSTPLTSQASLSLASEIRAHIKSLPQDKRNALIASKLSSKEDLTLGAVLGAPAFLSGLDDAMQAHFTRQYRETQEPVLAKRLKALTGAKALIEQRGGLVFKEIEKAVGMSPPKVLALRQARTAAEQALSFGRAS